MNSENKKFCINCGKEIPPTALYCPYCNTKQPSLESTYLNRSDVKTHQCPRCKNLIPDGAAYCPYCDEPQTRSQNNASQQQTSQPAKVQPSTKQNNKPRRRKSHFWRNVIVLLVVILLAVIAFFTYQNYHNSQMQSNQNQTSQAQTGKADNNKDQANQSKPQNNIIEIVKSFTQNNKYESGQDAAQDVQKVVDKIPDSSGSNVKWNPNTQTVNVNLPSSSPIVKSIDSSSPQVWDTTVKALQTISQEISNHSTGNDDYSNIKVVRDDTGQPVLQVDKGNVSLNSRTK
ncbi:zinc ribbon domain-containing protein [Fructilactobacillus cliffordii]|uniref:Zinc ribbon domain-containing protein n=1 Tax=Fructilactobacillus cliffordii TaxID=2940299 RepID=A0A9Q8ZUB2_9LACO|nr:zinc ribbon domain-containing protein [Fructilactobacillus cliffordii]USS86349.1 zinc ribbon domain-containing protein [Fructilactobacillus cliffordii]USS89417.1 zinc ribbon domain-containing protein [Fructilactobacillus cliffordii]